MTPPRPGLAEVVVADDPDGWRAAGFALDADGACRIGPTTLRLAGAAAPGGRGVTGWTLAHIDATGLTGGTLDGLPTATTDDPPGSDAPDGGAPTGDTPAGDTLSAHPNGATAIDHVVVITPDLTRTVDAFAAVGLSVRGTRDATAAGRPIRQQFLRLGPTLVEVVGSPDTAGEGDAGFFGLAFTVADLDAAAALLGERLGPASDAVQPGRRIATLRHRDLGLSVPVAFMTPEPAPR